MPIHIKEEYVSVSNVFLNTTYTVRVIKLSWAQARILYIQLTKQLN